MRIQRDFIFNYLYFGLLFLVTASLHLYHLHLLQGEGPRGLLIVTTLAECGLEVLVLALLSFVFKRGLLRLFFLLGTLFYLLTHLIEFPLMRLMGLSFFDAIGIVLDESLENFIELLKATHVPLKVWAMGFLGLVVFLAVGLYFFRVTKGLSKKKWGMRPLCNGLVACLLSLLSVGVSGRFVDCPAKLCQALPWKGIFFNKGAPLCCNSTHLIPFPEEALVKRELSSLHELEEKPDLFFFVVESLREDFINSLNAPNFSTFRNEGKGPARGIASGNGTQLSWFSIFFSKIPLHFSHSSPEQFEGGSFGLQALKKLGYKIHLFSSSGLNYYQMDQRIFGKNKELIDSAQCFGTDQGVPAHQCDRETVGSLMEQVVQTERGGNCYIVFLESTHFDYSYPSDHRPFSPDIERLSHLKLALLPKELEQVKNSYRNAIHYVDSLFGEFRTLMERSGHWDEAVVALMGDHGEEFFEEGHLFHASNLSTQQTHIPLYLKFGQKELPGSCVSKLVSHVDIIPTFLHYLTGKQQEMVHVFDGESIFKEGRTPYAVCCRFNGGRDPKDFVVYTEEDRFEARYEKGEGKGLFKRVQMANLFPFIRSHPPSSGR